MRLGFGEDAGEAVENLQEGGDGGVVERHVMLFRREKNRSSACAASYASLTRVSIIFAGVFRSGWITGSSRVMPLASGAAPAPRAQPSDDAGGKKIHAEDKQYPEPQQPAVGMQQPRQQRQAGVRGGVGRDAH